MGVGRQIVLWPQGGGQSEKRALLLTLKVYVAERRSTRWEGARASAVDDHGVLAGLLVVM